MTRHGTRHGLFLAYTSRNEHRLFLSCAKNTTFQNTSCMSMPSELVARGSLTISRVRWPKRLLLAPIKRPIASVSAQHGLCHNIKYVRLLRRKASSSQAKAADHDGNRYSVQLVLVLQPHL